MGAQSAPEKWRSIFDRRGGTSMMAEPVGRLAPDTALPQRDLLLDAPWITGHLSRLLGNGKPASIVHCERLRVNYQIGKSLRVLHRMVIDGSPHMLGAHAFRKGRGQTAFNRSVARGLTESRRL